MNHHDKDLLKELKALKSNQSIRSQKKETMKMALREHAKKKQAHEKRKAKTKKTFIWFSSAAAIVLCSVFVYYLINNNQLSMPIADQESQSESNEIAKNQNEITSFSEEGQNQATETEEEAPTNDGAPENATEPEENAATFSIQENGQETDTVMIEGMEEEVTVHNFTMEPYGIQFQIEDFLSNHTVENDEVRFYSEGENAEVRFRIAESTTIESLIPHIQEEYNGDFHHTEEPSPLPEEENPYHGMTQHFSEPPQGYYLYQIDDHVLVIQYEYIIEAADGMGPRLEKIRESIK